MSLLHPPIQPQRLEVTSSTRSSLCSLLLLAPSAGPSSVSLYTKFAHRDSKRMVTSTNLKHYFGTLHLPLALSNSSGSLGMPGVAKGERANGVSPFFLLLLPSTSAFSTSQRCWQTGYTTPTMRSYFAVKSVESTTGMRLAAKVGWTRTC